MNCDRILMVSSPEAGEWRAEITGTGRYWVEAQAQSDIYFVGVEVVKKGGRPGYEGLLRIQGQPVVGTPATLQASLSANTTTITKFYLVTEVLRLLQSDRVQKLFQKSRMATLAPMFAIEILEQAFADCREAETS